jgi:hypothetical protein
MFCSLPRACVQQWTCIVLASLDKLTHSSMFLRIRILIEIYVSANLTLQLQRSGREFHRRTTGSSSKILRQIFCIKNAFFLYLFLALALGQPSRLLASKCMLCSMSSQGRDPAHQGRQPGHHPQGGVQRSCKECKLSSPRSADARQ